MFYKECTDVRSFSDGLAVVKNENGTWSYINKEGKKLPGEYKAAVDFSDGLAVVQNENGTYSYINKEGLFLVDGRDNKNYLEAIQNDYKYISQVPVNLMINENFQELIVESVKINAMQFIDEHSKDSNIKELTQEILEKSKELFDKSLEKAEAIQEKERKEAEAIQEKRRNEEKNINDSKKLIESFDFGTKKSSKGESNGRDKK